MFGLSVLTDVVTENLSLLAGSSVRLELMVLRMVSRGRTTNVARDSSQCVVGLLDGGVLDFVDQFMETFEVPSS